MPIKKILFDCDNTLVLSEDVAFDACAELISYILAKHGVHQRSTGDMLIEQFVGQTFCGMLKSLIVIHGMKISIEEIDMYIKSDEDVVIGQLEAKAKPCVGANETLAKLHAEKKYDLAIVSSSGLRRIRAALDKAGLSTVFPNEHIFSAATSLPKPIAKPDPAIYLSAMKKLGVKPEECVAVEDSRSGATSACRASIRTIAYVGCYNGERKRKEIGELLKRIGCCKVMVDWSELPAILAEIEAMPQNPATDAGFRTK